MDKTNQDSAQTIIGGGAGGAACTRAAPPPPARGHGGGAGTGRQGLSAGMDEGQGQGVFFD